MYYVQAEKLDIEMKEMLALGEKVAGLKEKLATVPEDKKERAKETLGISSEVCFWPSMQTAPMYVCACPLICYLRWLDKLNALKGKVDVVYEKITDIQARVAVNMSADKKDEKPLGYFKRMLKYPKVCCDLTLCICSSGAKLPSWMS